MKKSILHQIALLISALTLSASAWATPSATSPYVTDPQNEYVQDATSDAIGSLNMVLCIMGSMNMNGSGMLNVGPYIALVDVNKCQSKGSAGGSAGGSSGASAAVNYMTAIVNATRASSTAPMIADIWMSLTQMGMVTNVYVKVTATQSPTDVPPYGVFRMDYIGKNQAGAVQFNGFINATASNLQFYETGQNSSNVALTMAAGSTTSGSGTMTTGASPNPVVTYNFNYNPTNFLRGTQCFDRTKANADRSVWRLGTYNANDGSRVDQTNPSFQITATYLGSSYYGYAGYYGIGFQGLNLNTIPDASPISGLVVTDQRPGNTTTYSLSKVGGKLTKWTQHLTNLAAMDGIPFTFNGDLTGKTTPAVTNPGTSSGWGNWQMQWNNSTAKFTVTGVQTCGMSGCALSTIATSTVNVGALTGVPISGWSDSFGGNINIPSSTVDHISTDPVYYFSQSTVIPGTVPLTLSCLNNCPDAASVAAANAYTSGMAPSPYNATTATQWFSAPSSGVTVSYTFGAGGLAIGATPMIISNPGYYAASPMYQNGVMSGRLFDTALLYANCPAGTAAGTVCEPGAPAAYYTWSTGTDQWNQSLWLTNGSTVVAFDPPQDINYLVPTGAAYGTWAGKTIKLQFNGFGNLNGIPGYCVNPADNSVVDCSTANARYVPMFSIPDGATMTLGTTPLIVKALDAEIRLKDLGAGAAACSAMTLTTQAPPTGGVHDMSKPSDAYYIGVKPTVTASPKVIDGIVQ